MTWYAVHTRSRHENKVFDGLRQKAFEAFLPKISVWSARKDRKKRITVPLFPGYLFVDVENLTGIKMVDILKTFGVVRILGNRIDGTPAPVPEDTMGTIRKLAQFGFEARQAQYPKLGEPSVIIDGPFQGVEGLVVKTDYKNEMFVISFAFLNRHVSLPLKGHQIRKL